MAPVVKAKKAGKENAPPKSKVAEPEVEAEVSFEDMQQEDTKKSKSNGKLAAQSATKDKQEGGEEEPQRALEKKGPSSDSSKKIATLTSENDRLRKQRDAFSKQFDELSRIRNTDSEKLFDKFKQNVDIQTKAQNEIIETMTKLNEKQSSRIAALEKSLAAAQKNAELAASTSGSTAVQPPKAAEPAPVASSSSSNLTKSDLKELKALREEVSSLRKGVKEKDQKITQLEKEYEAEVAQSRTLQASTRGAPSLAASTSIPPMTEESEKDAICLAFYEDMTELQIVNVKVRKDPKTGKEATLNCLHTNLAQNRSLQFKIRTFSEISPELVAQKAENPWIRKIYYQPGNLAIESDKAFVDGLGHFKEEFAIERKQLSEMWDELRKRVAGEEDEEDEEGDE